MVSLARKCNQKTFSVVTVSVGVPTSLPSSDSIKQLTFLYQCSLKPVIISSQSSTSDIKKQIFHRCYFYHALDSRAAEDKSDANLSLSVISWCLEAFDSYIYIFEIQMYIFIINPVQN